VGKLRAYGNAIVAPLAQAFIESWLEHERDMAQDRIGHMSEFDLLL
jgi:hypothetical protein